MPKTENINLNLTEDVSTYFNDWRESIDGNNEITNKSNMQLIDDAFGKLKPVSIYTNVSATFVSDSTYDNFVFKGTISIIDVTDSDIAEVYFDMNEATSGNYAPICQTFNGGVYIYSKISTTITIPTVKVYKSWQ